MYAQALRFLWCAFGMAVLVVPQAYAGDELTVDSLLAGSLLEQDEYDDADVFTDEVWVQEPIVVGQNDSLQLSIEHTLAVNPSGSYERTNHYTEARLSSEAPIGLLAYAELELKATHYWQGDTSKPTEGDFSHLDIQRLVLHYSLADISIKLGRYLLSWGEVEGAGVIDVINPLPSLASSLTELTPQWLLSGNYYLPSAQVSWFVGLDPSVSELPGLALAHGVGKEWGAKYGHTGLGSDWAVYTGRMVPNNPVLNLATATASAQSFPWIGYSWNKAIDGHLIKFDIAHKRGLEHNLGYMGLTRSHRLDAALGLELNHGDRQWSASVSGQRWLNYQSSYLTPTLTPALTPVASHQTQVTYILGLSDSFNADEYRWSLSHLDTDRGALRATTGELVWQATDRWQSSLSYTTMTAKRNSAYALLDGTQRLILKAKLSY
jgi:hypothetical protein